MGDFILRALTLNIWNRQGPWDERLRLIRAGLEQLDPHVIGLQEVLSDGTRSLAHDIADGLGYEVAFGEAKALAGGISFGNAVLSRFPIRQQRVFALPNADTDDSRSALVTLLATPDAPLPFVSTHLAWRIHHGFVRERQVLALAQVLERELPTDDNTLPAVVVGDFNAAPDATEIRFVRGLHALDGVSTFLADCFGETGQGPGYTFDARHNPYAAFSDEAPRRIDYIFVRGPDERRRGKPLSARVVLDRVVDGVAPSDHWGVFAQIRM